MDLGYKYLVIGLFSTMCHFGVNGDDWALKLNPDEKAYNKFAHDSLYVNCYHKNATGIAWYKNDHQKIPETRARVSVEPGLDSKGLALVFTNMEVSDSGNYTCKAKINNVEVKTAFRLIVYSPINFADTPSVQKAIEGEPFSIRCEARGDPEPAIRWIVPGRTVPSPQYKQLGDGLSISRVTREDANVEFICRAMQMRGEVQNFKDQPIKLDVLYRPQWKSNGTTTAYGYMGGTANVTCQVDANPPANFTWFNKANQPIGPGIRDVKIFSDGNKSVLSISKFNVHVIGNYTCRARNSLGELRRVFNLKEGPKPVPPKKPVVHSATHNSLKLEIHSAEDIRKGFEITGYKVQILEKREREKGKGWEVAKEVILQKGKTNTYVIPDLSPKTEYLIRVHSINAAGPSDYTDELKVQTSNSAKATLSNALIFIVLLFVTRFT